MIGSFQPSFISPLLNLYLTLQKLTNLFSSKPKTTTTSMATTTTQPTVTNTTAAGQPAAAAPPAGGGLLGGLTGGLTSGCPSKSFRNTFTRRSQILCLFWAPDEADDIADSIFAANIGDSDTPLRSWSFVTLTDNPLIRSSQYVSITMPDMEGSDTRYRPVKFSIEII